LPPASRLLKSETWATHLKFVRAIYVKLAGSFTYLNPRQRFAFGCLNSFAAPPING